MLSAMLSGSSPVGSSPKASGSQRVSVTPADAHAMQQRAGVVSRKREAPKFSDEMFCVHCEQTAVFEQEETELVCTNCGVIIDNNDKVHQPFKLPRKIDAPMTPEESSTSMLVPAQPDNDLFSASACESTEIGHSGPLLAAAKAEMATKVAQGSPTAAMPKLAPSSSVSEETLWREPDGPYLQPYP